jgi:hypothetical protein
MYFELHLEILDQNMLKAKFDVVFDFMSQKSNVNFVILHLFYLYHNWICLCLLYFKLNLWMIICCI